MLAQGKQNSCSRYSFFKGTLSPAPHQNHNLKTKAPVTCCSGVSRRMTSVQRLARSVALRRGQTKQCIYG